MLGFVYGLVSYLGFLGVFVYFAWFTSGPGITKTVDSGVPGALVPSLAVDLGLILLFGLQHSIMARSGFKRRLTRLLPQGLERTTYVLASSLALAALVWLWRPLPFVLYHVPGRGLAAALYVISALGWLGVPFSSLLIDHFDLFGVKRAFNAWRHRSFTPRGFVTPLLYKYVRHPMMTSLFFGLWATPHLTLGHLVLSAGMSIYIVVGVHFEERALAAELGPAYVRYQASTPKFLPFGKSAATPERAPESAPISRTG
jgi:protein-S-isoprenylcysteine O-methyltransferase Ste14